MAEGGMKDSVVLYPTVGLSHLKPMVELAKLFSRLGFAATVLLPHCPIPAFAAEVDSFVDLVVSADLPPSISFHRIAPTPPPPPPPPPVSIPGEAPHEVVALMFRSIRLNNPSILSFIRSHSETHRVRALFLDFFCTDALDVAAELGLPSFILFSCAAGDLNVFLHLPTLASASELSFKDMGDAPLDFPGVPLIPASHLPRQLMDRESVTCKLMIRNFKRLAEADGILINSFEELEKYAVEALRDGSCVPGRRMPAVYCIGPMIAERYDASAAMHNECIAWLDSQPRGSVVFLCFGTIGAFTEEQIKEIAVGLERSGQRFLWVVRAPVAPGAHHMDLLSESAPEPDIGELMPEGFLDRTRERGKVVKSWAPQWEVLRHEAVGGFVTHCGWNSVLESIVNGVPMIAWPLYAEQWVNKVLMTEVMKVAVVMDGYDKELVAAEDVEKKVRWLMESEGADELRRRTLATKKKATESWRETGSSYGAWSQLVAALMKTKS